MAPQPVVTSADSKKKLLAPLLWVGRKRHFPGGLCFLSLIYSWMLIFTTDLASLYIVLVCGNLPPSFYRMSAASLPGIPQLDGIHHYWDKFTYLVYYYSQVTEGFCQTLLPREWFGKVPGRGRKFRKEIEKGGRRNLVAVDGEVL